jgi:hypothetical protein
MFSTPPFLFSPALEHAFVRKIMAAELIRISDRKGVS